jgi:serine/threonine-protein phosphatase 4 regulatory subunit 1
MVKNELSSLDSESSDEVTTDELQNSVNVPDSCDEGQINPEQIKSLQDDPDSILEAHISDTIDKSESDDPKADGDTSEEGTRLNDELENPTNGSNPDDTCDNVTKDDIDDSKPTYAEAVKTCKEPELQIGRWETYGARSSLHSSKSSLDSLSLVCGGGGGGGVCEAPHDLALPRGPPQTCQSIVPQLLIDHYVSMIDPSRAQTVDNDIARHCAFSLPAVALTLGRTNWPLIKETYETLANDMQWKVRRTVASSIHELGVILGEEIAAEDLVPIFDGFIKDLDEVRIGALKHLSVFLSLLAVSARTAYLPRLGEFLKMDNERNWRFRLELCEQLGHTLTLFSGPDVRQHLTPIVTQLVTDKVAAVRLAAARVLAVMLSQLHSTGCQVLATSLASNMVEVLGNSAHWARRQTYVVLCGEVASQGQTQTDKKIIYSPTSFSSELLPHLLDLTWDKVPNVRLAVARVVMQLSPDYYISCKELVVSALAQLKQDKDRNVREAAGEPAESTVTEISTSEQDLNY